MLNKYGFLKKNFYCKKIMNRVIFGIEKIAIKFKNAILKNNFDYLILQ